MFASAVKFWQQKEALVLLHKIFPCIIQKCRSLKTDLKLDLHGGWFKTKNALWSAFYSYTFLIKFGRNNLTRGYSRAHSFITMALFIFFLQIPNQRRHHISLHSFRRLQSPANVLFLIGQKLA